MFKTRMIIFRNCENPSQEQLWVCRQTGGPGEYVMIVLWLELGASCCAYACRRKLAIFFFLLVIAVDKIVKFSTSCLRCFLLWLSTSLARPAPNFISCATCGFCIMVLLPVRFCAERRGWRSWVHARGGCAIARELSSVCSSGPVDDMHGRYSTLQGSDHHGLRLRVLWLQEFGGADGAGIVCRRRNFVRTNIRVFGVRLGLRRLHGARARLNGVVVPSRRHGALPPNLRRIFCLWARRVLQGTLASKGISS